MGIKIENYLHECLQCVQVKNVYVRFLYHCYIDTEVDNKETFTKEHVWELFKSFLVDIAKVSLMFCLWLGTVNTWLQEQVLTVLKLYEQ